MRIAIIALLVIGCGQSQIIARIPAATPVALIGNAQKEGQAEKTGLPRLDDNDRATNQLFLKSVVRLSVLIPIAVKTRYGMASGVVLQESGVILTCRHCVEGEDEITLRLTNQADQTAEYKAEIIALDTESDLGAIRVKGDVHFPSVAIIDEPDGLERGDKIYSVANPLARGEGLFQGTVVNLRYSYRDNKDPKRDKIGIRIDLIVAPGSSGSGIFSAKNGKLAGITVAVDTELPRIGVAVPAKAIRVFLDKNKIRYRAK